jgi:hypothetical protein
MAGGSRCTPAVLPLSQTRRVIAARITTTKSVSANSPTPASAITPAALVDNLVRSERSQEGQLASTRIDEQ